jgi:hypothetical protein
MVIINLTNLKVPSTIYKCKEKVQFCKELENCDVVLSSQFISRHIVALVP